MLLCIYIYAIKHIYIFLDMFLYHVLRMLDADSKLAKRRNYNNYHSDISIQHNINIILKALKLTFEIQCKIIRQTRDSFQCK